MKYLRVNPQPYKRKNHTNIHVWNYKKTHQRKHIYEYESKRIETNNKYENSNYTHNAQSHSYSLVNPPPRLIKGVLYVEVYAHTTRNFIKLQKDISGKSTDTKE